MTEQLEGPELWLRVAEIIGLEMHVWVREKGYSIQYRDEPPFEREPVVTCILTCKDVEWKGQGPTDSVALGRAIVEAWG